VNELLEHLKQDFQNEEARYAYAESVANAYVSEQIKRLRQDRGLSQEELAALIGTKQSGISRLQNKDYSAWKVETLRKLAKAFGVRLRISFEEFGTITDDVAGFNESDLVPRKFADDPVFNSSTTGTNSIGATQR
jgi:transcriptional regulator with XRE-family HTH domain